MESPSQPHPSFFLALRVLQLVNRLRVQQKTRIRSRKLGNELLSHRRRRELEQAAIHDVGHWLRTSDRTRNGRRCQNRVSKPGSGDCPGQTWSPRNALDEELKHSHHSLDRLLREADEKFSSPAFVPSKVALDHSLFLGRRTEPEFRAWPLLEVARALTLVNTALDSIRSSPFNDARLLCRGNEIVNTALLDENLVSNLEHILLVLRQALVHAFIRKSNIQSLVRQCLEELHDEVKQEQKYWKLQRKLLDWFSEYAGGRPLSTTWPWTIRPSLAVLWGVCWMFPAYEGEGQADGLDQWFKDLLAAHHTQAAQPGSTLAKGVAGQLLPRWQPPRADEYERFGRELTGLSGGPAAAWDYNMRAALGVQRGVSTVSLGHGHSRVHGHGLGHGLGLGYGVPQRSRHLGGPTPGGSGHVQSRHPRSLGGATRAAGAQPRRHRHPPAQPHLPGPSGFGDAPAACHASFNTTSASPPNASSPRYWQPQAATHWSPATHRGHIDALRQPTLPPRSPGLLQPVVTLPLPTVTVEGLSSPPPSTARPYISSAVAAPPPSDLPDPSMYGSDDNDMTLDIHISPENGSITMSNISTPPLTPEATTMTESSDPNLKRKLSAIEAPSSDAVQNAPGAPDQRGNLSPEPDDEPGSPLHRGKFSHKRKEDPPRNASGKMICTFDPGCKTLIFERKCEWSKHMDKHDRPYVCKHRGCEKLQGFTYSGGLLRHEREVHKLHGGTKKSMFCPYQDCKRSSGTGFTRKENLHEHVRRVHRRASASDNLPNDANNNEDVSQAVSPAAELAEEYTTTDRTKRRRTESATVATDPGDGLHAYLEDPKGTEIRHLRNIIEGKDEELRRAHEQLRRKDDTIRNLEDLLSGQRRDLHPSSGPI